MLGNDLVFFENTSNNESRLARKFEKLFHVNEIRLKEKYFTSQDYSILWSIKETAYKAIQRRFNLPMKLNPHQFQLATFSKIGNTIRSEVLFNNIKLNIVSIVNHQFVYSYMGKNLIHYFNFDVFYFFSAKIDLSVASLLPSEISKDLSGFPFIVQNDIFFPTSKTHDKNFTAYCWELE